MARFGNHLTQVSLSSAATSRAVSFVDETPTNEDADALNDVAGPATGAMTSTSNDTAADATSAAEGGELRVGPDTFLVLGQDGDDDVAGQDGTCY